MNLVIEKHLFCSFNSSFEYLPIFNFLEWSVDSEFYLTLFILPSFGLFGHIDNCQMFLPYQFWSMCILLTYEFKRILVRDNQSINVPNSMNEIRNEFFFFLAVFNDSTLFVLNEFFCYNYINSKRSMIRWISDIRINTVIIDFYGVRMEEE